MDISDRIKYSKFESTKLNVVDSIGVFQQKNIQLNRTKDKLLGLLPWHRHMDARFSTANNTVIRIFHTESLGRSK